MFTASQLAKAAGIPVFTVRYYTRIGLLTPTKHSGNGYHIYSADDLATLKFAANAKDLGFTLKEIEHILDQSGRGDSPCPMVREIVERRISENKRQIKELQRLQKRLESAADLWLGMENSQPNGHSVCNLIETFARHEKTA